MKTAKRQYRRKQTRRYHGSGATMSRPSLSDKDTLKQKYAAMVMREVKKFYDRRSWVNFVNTNSYKPTTIVPSFFRSRPELNKTQTDTETLKKILKEQDIDRNTNLLSRSNMASFDATTDWLNDFYTEVAYKYLTSKNQREYLRSIKNRQDEFFMQMENVYLPKHIKITEVRTAGETREVIETSASDNDFYIDIIAFETLNGRVYKINCLLNQPFFTKGCDILFNTNCFFYNRNPPLSPSLEGHEQNRLFDKDGYPILAMDDYEKMLQTMSAHPSARNTLTPDVVDEMMRLTKSL